MGIEITHRQFVLLLCPRPIDVESAPRSSSNSFPLCLHNTLGTKIPGFGTCTVALGIFHRSSDSISLSSIP